MTITRRSYVTCSSDIKDQHWYIMHFSTIFIPGDERSHTNPGHGYPESTRKIITYELFLDRAEWESEVIYLTKRGEHFAAAKAIPASVITTTSVQVSND